MERGIWNLPEFAGVSRARPVATGVTPGAPSRSKTRVTEFKRRAIISVYALRWPPRLLATMNAPLIAMAVAAAAT